MVLNRKSIMKLIITLILIDITIGKTTYSEKKEHWKRKILKTKDKKNFNFRGALNTCQSETDCGCPINKYCDKIGGKCRDKRYAGQGCKGDYQCLIGNCVNEVCELKTCSVASDCVPVKTTDPCLDPSIDLNSLNLPLDCVDGFCRGLNLMECTPDSIHCLHSCQTGRRKCTDGLPGSPCAGSENCEYSCDTTKPISLCTDGSAGTYCPGQNATCLYSCDIQTENPPKCTDGSPQSYCEADEECQHNCVTTEEVFKCSGGWANAICAGYDHSDCTFACNSTKCTDGLVGSYCEDNGHCKDLRFCNQASKLCSSFFKKKGK